MSTAPTPEPSNERALHAALAGPTFATNLTRGALATAARHIERWAPESGTHQRALSTLGFIDRLVSPWIEAAHRSVSLRMFAQMSTDGFPVQRPPAMSWVFPRPWYRDELAWMAAARVQQEEQTSTWGRGALFTTRGTYVAPTGSPTAPPVEYVAPSLSLAIPPSVAPTAETATPLDDMYSPLISLAAVQAASVMAHGLARIPMASQTPALRSVLGQLLAQSSAVATPTVHARNAPELVTPPAPRAPVRTMAAASDDGEPAPPPANPWVARAVSEQLVREHAQLVAIQQVAIAEATRAAAAVAATSAPVTSAPVTSTPVTSAPVTSTPVTSAPVTSAPVTSAPVTSAPVTSAPATATPAVTATATSAPILVTTPATSATSASPVPVQAEVDAAAASPVVHHPASIAASGPSATATGEVLHQRARLDAAIHARGELLGSPFAVGEVVATTTPTATAATPTELPPALVEAVAALPEPLAQALLHDPGRVHQTLDELITAYRSIELMTSAGSVETIRGPRLSLPAGLGGLVVAIQQAPARATATASTAATAGAASTSTTAPTTSMAPTATWNALIRMPHIAYRPVPASALVAASAARPAAIGHVAWADRWLARFAGASQQSLDVLSVQPDARRAGTAPQAVFVVPRAPTTMARLEAGVGSESFVGEPFVRSVEKPSSVEKPRVESTGMSAEKFAEKFDDDAETPDAVFAAISQAATRVRQTPASPKPQTVAITPTSGTAVTPTSTTPPSPSATLPSPSAVTLAATTPAAAGGQPRPHLADVIAQQVPSAAGAGLAAQLASSPFASALRHLITLPTATPFDVRTLVGEVVALSYLSGLLSDRVERIAGVVRAGSGFDSLTAASASDIAEIVTRAGLAWQATYVAPHAPAALTTIAISGETTDSATDSAAPVIAVRSALTETGQTGHRKHDAFPPAASPLAASFAAAAADEPTDQPTVAAGVAPLSATLAAPMFADTHVAADESVWAAPGMIATRAHAWSVAQERSSSDLAFDFVSPELVLAARVYGLGPAEAAQAMRLAVAGPGQLSAMASTIDRTFVRALALRNDQRQLADALGVGETRTQSAQTGGSLPPSFPPSFAPSPPSAASTFGVERKLPRGAYLWPSATVASLGLEAPPPEGAYSMPVAALELLAARAVVELGTFAVLSNSLRALQPDDGVSSTGAPGREPPPTWGFAQAAIAAANDVAGAQPTERDVLSAALAIVPDSRRDRFEALYLAIGRTGTTSPAARAARALALAGRSDSDAPMSARERAMLAWDVLPVVYAGERFTFDADEPAHRSELMESGPGQPGQSSQLGQSGQPGQPGFTYAGGQRRPAPTRDLVAARSDNVGMNALAARAGEALGSYFTAPAPTAPIASKPERTRTAPTQELVQTGRSSGRYGGGEVEIPAWFESAARKMFERESTSTADSISMSDLTLISSAPRQQLAASTRTAPAAAPIVPGAGSALDAKPGQKIDIEKLAHEIYRQILVMMDSARSRNGEPYL